MRRRSQSSPVSSTSLSQPQSPPTSLCPTVRPLPIPALPPEITIPHSYKSTRSWAPYPSLQLGLCHYSVLLLCKRTAGFISPELVRHRVHWRDATQPNVYRRLSSAETDIWLLGCSSLPLQGAGGPGTVPSGTNTDPQEGSSSVLPTCP